MQNTLKIVKFLKQLDQQKIILTEKKYVIKRKKYNSRNNKRIIYSKEKSVIQDQR